MLAFGGGYADLIESFCTNLPHPHALDLETESLGFGLMKSCLMAAVSTATPLTTSHYLDRQSLPYQPLKYGPLSDGPLDRYMLIFKYYTSSKN